MESYDVVIIGGGAAGIMAAITAKRQGASVLVCEKMPKIGKKLLITGAGRCNLLNETLDASFYNPGSQALVHPILGQFGKESILGFFKELGLATYADETGRIFPVTNQAASVLKVLEMELERLKVTIDLGCEIKNIRVVKNGFEVCAKTGEKETCRKVIFCAGGKSYPALGADGNGYDLAAAFGHSILEPVPSTVAFLAKDPCCHFLQGQKVRAEVTSCIEGKKIRTASGELLFTQYGLSGTAILDVSDEISIAMNRKHIKNVSVIVDLVPFMNEPTLAEELSRRFEKGVTHANLLEGLLTHKFFLAFRGEVQNADASSIAHLLKHKEFKVIGTRGWNEAEFTAGGIPAEEVNPLTLESKLQKGLYFAGEVLDVQGRRGGYNLAWAWASGAVAGAQAQGNGER
ncbi:MAG: aminoacetone oxidase family FAD-binding enzyme [Candidatus Omnitrophota bacterium]